MLNIAKQDTYWVEEDIFDFVEAEAVCEVLMTNGVELITAAICHDDDMDFCSQKTGEAIATARMATLVQKELIKNEYRPKLEVLKHLQSCMEQSKKYNPKSYEACMLRRQIKYYETQIEEAKAFISENDAQLKAFIAGKDAYYKLIRERRAKENN